MRWPVLFVFAAMPLLGQTVRFDLVKDQSVIALRTDKAGLFSAFGHKHGILATEFSADICADPAALQNAAVTVRVVTGSLRADSPEARRAAGLTDSGPSAQDIATVQEKMLSAPNLAAADFPEIRFQSTAVEKRGSGLTLNGLLTIRGKSQKVVAPLQVTPGSDGLRIQSEFQVRQSDFGIKPESVGGVVKVADPVAIILRLLARPTTVACQL